MDQLPQSVRYIKLGEGGRWWPISRDRAQIHAGWGSIDDEAIAKRDFARLDELLRAQYGSKQGATQDFNQLKSLLEGASNSIWFTFEAGYLWWCTATDDLTVDPAGSQPSSGHFFLECDRRWSNRSVGGRLLAMSELPGSVTATAGFRGTTCEPRAAAQVRRIILDEVDDDVRAAQATLAAHREATEALVRKLSPKDFELLTDLILARSGWSRVAKLGGATEGIDVEVENPATNEIAFVQVKSTAGQAVLDDYVSRFSARTDRYSRMIFVVHTPRGSLVVPSGMPVQIWRDKDIASLAVRLGLSEWLCGRF
jgi:hypothetical protein